MTDLSTAAEVAQSRPLMRDLVERQRPAIERQLAGAMNSDAFIRAVLSEVAKSPGLQSADPVTVLGAVMLAAQLRLEIGSGLGEFWLTPRKDHGRDICLPIVGYSGLVKLALRSEFVTNVQAFIVRDGDTWSYGATSERGLFYDWTPLDFEEKRVAVGVVATARMRQGGTTWAYLTAEQVEARRPAYWKSTPWASHPDEMWKKTAVRALAKFLPKSTDLGRAIEADEQKVQHVRGVEELQVSRLDDEKNSDGASPASPSEGGDGFSALPPAPDAPAEHGERPAPSPATIRRVERAR